MFSGLIVHEPIHAERADHDVGDQLQRCVFQHDEVAWLDTNPLGWIDHCAAQIDLDGHLFAAELSQHDNAGGWEDGTGLRVPHWTAVSAPH